MVLLKDYPALGSAGQVVVVKAGHARNKLYPEKIALYATPKNELKYARAAPKAAVDVPIGKDEIDIILERLTKRPVVVRRRVSWKSGEEKRMVGCVTNGHVLQLVQKQLGVQLPAELLLMSQKLTDFGDFHVPVALRDKSGTPLELHLRVLKTRRMD